MLEDLEEHAEFAKAINNKILRKVIKRLLLELQRIRREFQSLQVANSLKDEDGGSDTEDDNSRGGHDDSEEGENDSENEDSGSEDGGDNSGDHSNNSEDGDEHSEDVDEDSEGESRGSEESIGGSDATNEDEAKDVVPPSMTMRKEQKCCTTFSMALSAVG